MLRLSAAIQPTRVLPRAAWLAWAATVVALAASIVIWASQRFALPPVRFLESAPVIGAEMLFSLACVTVGLILATKRVENPLGWVFIGLGATLTGAILTNFLVTAGHQVLRPMPVPILLSAWFFNSFQLPFSGLMSILVFLWFPDGHCLTRRWTWVGAAAGVGAGLMSLSGALSPRGLMWYPSLPNPFALPASYDGVIAFAGLAGLVIFLVALALATWSMVVRYRQADVVRRIQLKWIASAGMILAVSATPFLVVRYAFDMPDAVGSAALGLLMLAATLLPIAAGIAILRYRALDIDLLINRAVVYIAMTGILGGLYSAAVLLFQRIFIAVTGNSSDVALVLATLVLAGVFTPLRKSLEGLADKYVKPRDEEPPAPLQGYSTDPARPGLPGWDFNAGEPMAANVHQRAAVSTVGEPSLARAAAPATPSPSAPLPAASLGAAAADDESPAQQANDETARIAQLEARLRMLEEQLRREK